MTTDQWDTLPPPSCPQPTGSGPERSLGSRYLLGEQIGSGATGQVWRGRRRDSDEPVAVKLLGIEYARNQEAVTRFLRQRTILRSLEHPHLVQVYDLVAEGDLLAIVMELVAGEDLRRLAGRRTLRSDQLRTMLAQVAEALAAIHQAGVVHRDIKPENVLVRDPAGEPHALLTDFGLAGATEGPSDLTRLSQVIGTPAYIAPEVVMGRPATAATDVYALGVMAYELLAGQRPFTGRQAANTAALLRAHVEVEPPQPPGLAGPVWALVRSMLAKDPATRPAASAVAGELRRLGGPDRLPPPVPPPPPPPPPVPLGSSEPPSARQSATGLSGASGGATSLPDGPDGAGGPDGPDGAQEAELPTVGATRPAPVEPTPPPRRRRRGPVAVALATLAVLGLGLGLYLGRPDPPGPEPGPTTPDGAHPAFEWRPLPVVASSPEPGTVQLVFPDIASEPGFYSYVVRRDGDLLADIRHGQEASPYLALLLDPDTEHCFTVVALFEVDPDRPITTPATPLPACRKADGS